MMRHIGKTKKNGATHKWAILLPLPLSTEAEKSNFHRGKSSFYNKNFSTIFLSGFGVCSNEKKKKQKNKDKLRTLYAVYDVFTVLMNLHDFVTEPFNPEHTFRDACTVPFCLTADHISMCLMMFSARFKTAQFGSALDTW